MAGTYGLGATLSVNSTHAATLLVELTNIGDLSLTADDIDVTSHNERIKQYLKGQVELGEIPFSGNFLSSQAPALYNHLISASSTNEQTLEFPGSTGGDVTVAASGYLKNLGFGVPMDGKVSLTGAIKLSGHAFTIS